MYHEIQKSRENQIENQRIGLDGLEVTLAISELLLVVMGRHLASGMNRCHGWSVSLMLVLVLQAQMITIYYLGLIARKLMRLLSIL
jgi:hypothetical protein